MNEIEFRIENSTFKKPFEMSKLHLGKVLYIEFIEGGNDIKIHETQNTEAMKMGVSFIFTNGVILDGEYKVDQGRIEAMYQVLKEYIDRDIIFKKIESIGKQVRLEHSYKSKELLQSKIYTIYLVFERLDLIERFRMEKVAEQLFSHWQPLTIYHLLTCFDILGSKAQFLNFDEWVRKNSKQINLSETTSLSEQILTCYSNYKLEYGTKNSFYRFIDELLSGEVRDNLLTSVKFIKATYHHLGFKVTEETSYELVKKYLFEYRNLYTHRAQILPGTLFIGIDIPPESWSIVSNSTHEDHYLQTAIKNWPAVIENAVKFGLAEYIRQN